MKEEKTIKKIVYTCDDCGHEITNGENYKCDKTGKDLCYSCKHEILVTLCKEEYDKYEDDKHE